LRGSCGPRTFVPLAEHIEYMDDFRGAYRVVACEGERVVGFAGVDGDYICWLYVDPEHYGRGTGKRLSRRAISLAGPQAFTVTLAGNARALTPSMGARGS
jgi:GNAT superfamily N-acetyltransferase